MKTFRKIKLRPIYWLTLMTAIFAAILSGCKDPQTVAGTSSPRRLSSWIIPSTIDTFNVGNIHNAELYYLFTHYDTVKYAAYPNKLSLNGFDSLAHLFIEDSLQTLTGPLTSAQKLAAEAVFDSVFNACQTALPTHAQLVASVDTAVAHGILASDEGTFILNADTDIRLCSSWPQAADTISSLISQYNSITWTPSTSHGVQAYEFLSIANHSRVFWGQPGDTIMPKAAHPLETDADAYQRCYDQYEDEKAAMGWTEDQVIEMATECSSAASAANGTGTGNPGNGNNGNGNGNGGGGGGAAEVVCLVALVLWIIFG